MKLTSSTTDDIEQLTAWIKNDPYHRDCLNPVWWLTGNGLLSYCIQDSKGPTMYVRTDKENDLMRLHCQFAPESEVSKIRVVKSLLWALPKMEFFGKQNQLTGFVYKSTSPSLVQFMQIKFGFMPFGFDNDYSAPFEEV
jgi:hypothetical protein